MNLQQAFENIQHACSECPLTETERNSVNESIQIVVAELNSFDALKTRVKAAEERAKAVPVEKSKEEKNGKK